MSVDPRRFLDHFCRDLDESQVTQRAPNSPIAPGECAVGGLALNTSLIIRSCFVFKAGDVE